MKEKYTVCAFKEYEAIAGTMLESTGEYLCFTSSQAENKAEELVKAKKADVIYIHYNHHDSDCYWNPAIGFEPTGKDWVSHILAKV